ncbi:MAG: lipoyltransferase [Bacteroidaceae bacterium]|nr:lipoyltransferase [Bacteroidaceae bacterium]
MDIKPSTPTAAFPACHVLLPQGTEHRRASFYLAAEEYVAEALPEDHYFFTWQLNPTVVMGRNQVAHREINLDYCQRHHIDVIRRKSGGGCIYADRGNLMLSLITPKGAVEPLFAEYAHSVAETLCRLGASVMVSGRNDICLAEGGKVCGNAFYHLPHRNIVHGTMLYDTDAANMQAAITPDKSKLQKAGVASVKSRIGLLNQVLSVDIKTLRSAICNNLCNRNVKLTNDDVKHIEEIEKSYLTHEHLYGNNIRTALVHARRIEGCGKVEIRFSLRGSTIEEVQLTGDFFECGDATEAFRQTFVGTTYTIESLRDAVRTHHPEQSIRRLSETALLDLLSGEPQTE